MLPTNQTFRVFISSTFNDFQVERNALQELVFPRLTELCERHGARFQAIDLRWGVSEEAAHEQTTLSICLNEIARCRRLSPSPSFLLLLGDRYGWRPLPPEIPTSLFQRLLGRARRLRDGARQGQVQLDKYYVLDSNARPPVHCLRPRRGKLKDYALWAELERQVLELLQTITPERRLFGASATEQEIAAGVFSSPRVRGQSHIFLRTIHGLPRDARAGGYIDLKQGQSDQDALERLGRLKQRIQEQFRREVHPYQACWLGKGISTTHVEETPLPGAQDLLTEPTPRAEPRAQATPNLCREVYSSLAKVILKQIRSWQGHAPLQREVQLHERFLQEWGNPQLFTGRRQDLAQVGAYLRSAATWPLTVHGAPGCGKSALMARAVAEARRNHSHAAIVFRFLGVTPESSNPRALLESMGQEIASLYGDTQRPVPAAYLDLLRDFPERLKLARRERPLLVFLDALDQLSDESLSWLPQVLPDHVRVVVSTLGDPHPCVSVLRGRYPAKSLIELSGLPLQDGKKLLGLWLEAEKRTLQSFQRDVLLRRFARCPLPLWLKLAVAEARRWHSYDQAVPFPTSVPRLVENLFHRLSQPALHGPLLVARSLSYLAAAKNGLTESELLGVLSRDREFFDDFLQHAQSRPPQRRLPVVVWSRLFFDLEPYLSERQADGTTLFAFFHRQFREVVERSFLAESSGTVRHAALARYFAGQATQFSQEGQMILNRRKLSELPHQQLAAGLWKDLKDTLCDLSFIDSKCAAGLTYDLVADYDKALRSPDLPRHFRRQLEEFAHFVHARSHLLSRHPELTFQTALNEPDATAPAQAARRRAASGRAHRSHLRWLNKPQTISPCLLTCVGHRDLVNSCDVSPDGKLIVSASSDEELKIWDADSGRELRSLPSHHASIETCAFSPDGRQIVSGTRDGQVKLWDVAAGRESVRIAGHRDAVATCAFAADGKALASASYDGTVKVWDARTGGRLRTLRGQKGNSVACAFSPDNTRLVAGTSDGGIALWDLHTGRELLAFSGHDRGVWRCAFSPDGKWMISSSEDGTLKRWDARTGQCLHTFVGHRGPVWTCALSPDGRRLASGSKDMSVRLWDIESGRELGCLSGHTEAIWGMAFFPDGRRVVSASWDWSLRVWDTAATVARMVPAGRRGRRHQPTPSPPTTAKLQDGPTIACASSPDGRLYAAGCSDGTVRLWDATSGCAKGTFPVLTDYVTALGFSPDSRWLMIGGWDGTLKLVDVIAGRESATLPSHRHQIRACTFSSSGARALSASAEKIELWEVTARGLQRFRTWAIRKQSLQTCDLSPDAACLVVGHDTGQLDLRPVNGGRELVLGRHPDLVFCSFSPDGHHLVSSSSDGKLKLWDLRRRREIGTYPAHTGTIESCRFSPDGTRFVSSGWDHTVQIRTVRRPAQLVRLLGHTDQLQDSCFSADGAKVLSVGMDGTFRVWEAGTGAPLGLLIRPSNRACLSEFSRDGSRLVSGSHQHALKLWNVARAREESELCGHQGDILACSFSSDGKRLVSAASDNLVKVWDTASALELVTFAGHDGPVSACAFSPDGKTIASGSWDSTVRLWDARAAAPPRVLSGHRGWVQFILFSPDGRLLISCSQDEKLGIWDATTGQRLRLLSGSGGLIETVALSPDGQFLASGSADGTLRVWNVRKGSAACTFTGHKAAIRKIAFSPDGSQLLSASNDKTLKLWDTQTGRLQRTLVGHQGSVNTCAFSRKGTHVLSGSDDHFLKVWNTGTGAEAYSYWAGAAVLAAAWHRSGQIVAAGDAMGQVHLLELRP